MAGTATNDPGVLILLIIVLEALVFDRSSGKMVCGHHCKLEIIHTLCNPRSNPGDQKEEIQEI